MDNDSIFSGVSAHPAREVADQLHQWDHGHLRGEPFALLVGAVTTLAREVDRITPRVVEHDAGPAYDPGPGLVYLDAAHRLRVLLFGLAELQDMIRYGQARGAHQDTLTTVAVRLSALRETHRAAMDANE